MVAGQYAYYYVVSIHVQFITSFSLFGVRLFVTGGKKFKRLSISLLIF